MLILLIDMEYDFERQQREKERQERSRQLPTRLPPHQEAVLAMQRGAGNAAVGRMLSAFPHADTLHRRLGREPTGEAVVDREGCGARGVKAFTEGTRTHFASAEPSLEVAAHEATHQLQHAGVTRDGFLGPEGHAQAVARAVVSERPAAQLISWHGENVPSALRPYTEVPPDKQSPDEFPVGKLVRVSDDGTMVVRQDSEYGSHKLYATKPLIRASNERLKASGSVVRLKEGGDPLTGTPPELNKPGRIGVCMDLISVEPENVATSTSGTTMEIWADCGRSARDVMGIGGGSGKNSGQVTATYTADGKVVKTDSNSPKAMADEIIAKTLGGGKAADGWAKYQAMAPAERDTFDREHGINEYVSPGVGEGYTMATGGAPYPGKRTWNFHWAGVVMSNGSDHVTLENYAVGFAEAVNTDWDFQMYGPASKAGQTFHEQHKGSQQHGDMPTSMGVGPR
ncbi:MAG: hypothetical protein QOI48_1886 [Solirubrobacteraceae bacterium]|jgi:hypothetical protein|nr:hypothetical protein [Solirubrobacteraceae bacterium]